MLWYPDKLESPQGQDASLGAPEFQGFLQPGLWPRGLYPAVLIEPGSVGGQTGFGCIQGLRLN